jgi:hypothetical protein
VFAKACKLGLEGIVAKRAGSGYRSGNRRQWLKSKNRRLYGGVTSASTHRLTLARRVPPGRRTHRLPTLRSTCGAVGPDIALPDLLMALSSCERRPVLGPRVESRTRRRRVGSAQGEGQSTGQVTRAKWNASRHLPPPWSPQTAKPRAGKSSAIAAAELRSRELDPSRGMGATGLSLSGGGIELETVGQALGDQSEDLLD